MVGGEQKDLINAMEDRIKQAKKVETGGLRKTQAERQRLLAPWRSPAVRVESRVPLLVVALHA